MGIISGSIWVSFQGWGSFRGRDHLGVGIISGALQASERVGMMQSKDMKE